MWEDACYRCSERGTLLQRDLGMCPMNMETSQVMALVDIYPYSALCEYKDCLQFFSSQTSFEEVERHIATHWSMSHTGETIYTTTSYKTRNSPRKQPRKTFTQADLDPLELEGPFRCEQCNSELHNANSVFQHSSAHHKELSLTSLNIRHLASNRVFLNAALYRYALQCGIHDCHKFAGSNSSMEAAIKKLKAHGLKDHPDNNIGDFCYLDMGVEHADGAQHQQISKDDSILEEREIKNEPVIKSEVSTSPIVSFNPLQLCEYDGPFSCTKALCDFSCNSHTMFSKHWNLKHSDVVKVICNNVGYCSADGCSHVMYGSRKADIPTSVANHWKSSHPSPGNTYNPNMCKVISGKQVPSITEEEAGALVRKLELKGVKNFVAGQKTETEVGRTPARSSSRISPRKLEQGARRYYGDADQDEDSMLEDNEDAIDHEGPYKCSECDYSEEQKETTDEEECIEIFISSSNKQFTITTRRNERFCTVANRVCDLAGWTQSKTRFILDGERVPNGLTLFENQVQNHDVLEAFQEMSGGKGPDEDAILKMLEECDSDPEDEEESVEMETSSDVRDVQYKWYQELKSKLQEGTLKLNKSNYQDQKLLFLLETESLEPYEMLRLENVYSQWEQFKKWRDEEDKEEGNKNERPKPVHVKQKAAAKVLPLMRESRLKRNIQDSSPSEESAEIYEEITPSKRQKLLETFGLSTPSPLVKYNHVTENEMKRISVAVHLWADRKMGGIEFLLNTRLANSHFEDIIRFTGPTSQWKLMKDRTVPQLRSLWRNSLGGKHYYRGNKNTGFENEFQRHVQNDKYCPFGHCKSGIMCRMDVDLTVLTPVKNDVDLILTPVKTSSSASEENKPSTSRKLFEEKSGGKGTGHNEKVILNEGFLVDSKNADDSTPPKVVPVVKECQTKHDVQNEKILVDDENEEMEKETGHDEEILLDSENPENQVDIDDSTTPSKESCPCFNKECQTKNYDKNKEILVDSENPLLSQNEVVKDAVTSPPQVVPDVKECQTKNDEDKTYVCILDCGKVFKTFFGYERHLADKHSSTNHAKVGSTCQICNKKVIYLDQHMRTNHSDVQKPIKCDICLVDIKENVLKHRKTCIKCRYCDYQNDRKSRLLNHIQKCPKKTMEHGTVQTYEEPLDLRSPMKVAVTETDENTNHEADNEFGIQLLISKDSAGGRLVSKDSGTQLLISKDFEKDHLVSKDSRKELLISKDSGGGLLVSKDSGIQLLISKDSAGGRLEKVSSQKVLINVDINGNMPKDIDSEKIEIKTGEEKEALEKGRTRHPFDAELKDEDYYSEFEIDDDDLYTIHRRKNKDDIELELRQIDSLQNTDIEGDNMIVEKFTEFMRNKRKKENNEGGYSKQTERSTINLYAGAVRNDILAAFHRCIKPFDARWLIDCKTHKDCKFDGEERLHINPDEPIYMTSRILQEALKRHEASGNSGNQKKKVIAAFNQLMEFIEWHFTLKLNAYGVDVLNKVLTYHQSVKNFVKGTSYWKKFKDEENEAYESNKIIRDYESPNKDIEVLEKYKEYVKSEERIAKISKLLSYAYPDAESPTPALMTEFGINMMEEIVSCTGCRPKVARHLTMGALVDAKPGFNPHTVDKGDKTVEEEFDGDTIWRRVNPNLPPPELACIHQIRDESALCSENCGNQCVPDGVNIWCTWDKTYSTRGGFFLHIPMPVKDLMDRYDIIRTNFFKGKKPKFSSDESWLEDADTPFFLNSACNSFPSLDLKKLSAILGIDVTAYAFRKIVSTWALTHKSKEIRRFEEEALQHSIHVAKERYLQSKQIQPQTLTQCYTQEETLFPENFRKELEKDKGDVETVIAKKQEGRAKVRYSNLSKQKDLSKKLKYENRPLGVRMSILESDRQEFVKIFEGLTGCQLATLIVSLKPIQFRDCIVRVVYSSTGETGETLRKVWVRIYRGDLLHGIRDLRSQAKECNWPMRKQNPGRKDRNSWIAHGLKKSCQAAQKFDDTSFTEPNLPPLRLSDDMISIPSIRSTMPELPAQTRARLCNQFGLSPISARKLVECPNLLDYFLHCVTFSPSCYKDVADLVFTLVQENSSQTGLPALEIKLKPEILVEASNMKQAREISSTGMQEVLGMVLLGDTRRAKEIVKDKDLFLIKDKSYIKEFAREIIETKSDLVEEHRKEKNKKKQAKIFKVLIKEMNKDPRVEKVDMAIFTPIFKLLLEKEQ